MRRRSPWEETTLSCIHTEVGLWASILCEALRVIEALALASCCCRIGTNWCVRCATDEEKDSPKNVKLPAQYLDRDCYDLCSLLFVALYLW